MGNDEEYRYLTLGGKDGRTPVAVDVNTWADWFEKANRSVGRTRIGNSVVSTVFLGLGDAVFETVLMGERGEEYCVISDTWEDAELEHGKAVMSIHLEKEPTGATD
jgi:hypothetical protein